MDKNETPHSNIDMLLPKETRLRFSGEYEPVAAWRLLSRYISRYPQDLRVHAQRVLLALDEQSLAEQLSGALQDLSISLSGKGKPFFTSLLDQAKPELSEHDYQHFMDLFDGADKQDQCWQKGSILAKGICDGKPIIVYNSDEEAAGFTDALEEARAYIEYGQIEEAQQLLEKELLADPTLNEIEEELLYLYRSVQHRNDFEMMTNKLQELGTELSPEWELCQQESKSW